MSGKKSHTIVVDADVKVERRAVVRAVVPTPGGSASGEAVVEPGTSRVQIEVPGVQGLKPGDRPRVEVSISEGKGATGVGEVPPEVAELRQVSVRGEFVPGADLASSSYSVTGILTLAESGANDVGGELVLGAPGAPEQPVPVTVHSELVAAQHTWEGLRLEVGDSVTVDGRLTSNGRGEGSAAWTADRQRNRLDGFRLEVEKIASATTTRGPTYRVTGVVDASLPYWDATGTWALEGVSEGTYSIARDEGSARIPMGQGLELDPGGTISATVTLEDAVGGRQASATVPDDENRVERATLTGVPVAPGDPDTPYQLELSYAAIVPSGGGATLEVSGVASAAVPVSGHGAAGEVELGEPAVYPSGATLEVTVTLPGAEPVTAAWKVPHRPGADEPGDQEGESEPEPATARPGDRDVGGGTATVPDPSAGTTQSGDDPQRDDDEREDQETAYRLVCEPERVELEGGRAAEIVQVRVERRDGGEWRPSFPWVPIEWTSSLETVEVVELPIAGRFRIFSDHREDVPASATVEFSLPPAADGTACSPATLDVRIGAHPGWHVEVDVRKVFPEESLFYGHGADHGADLVALRTVADRSGVVRAWIEGDVPAGTGKVRTRVTIRSENGSAEIPVAHAEIIGVHLMERKEGSRRQALSIDDAPRTDADGVVEVDVAAVSRGEGQAEIPDAPARLTGAPREMLDDCARVLEQELPAVAAYEQVRVDVAAYLDDFLGQLMAWDPTAEGEVDDAYRSVSGINLLMYSIGLVAMHRRRYAISRDEYRRFIDLGLKEFLWILFDVFKVLDWLLEAPGKLRAAWPTVEKVIVGAGGGIFFFPFYLMRRLAPALDGLVQGLVDRARRLPELLLDNRPGQWARAQYYRVSDLLEEVGPRTLGDLDEEVVSDDHSWILSTVNRALSGVMAALAAVLVSLLNLAVHFLLGLHRQLFDSEYVDDFVAQVKARRYVRHLTEAARANVGYVRTKGAMGVTGVEDATKGHAETIVETTTGVIAGMLRELFPPMGKEKVGDPSQFWEWWLQLVPDELPEEDIAERLLDACRRSREREVPLDWAGARRAVSDSEKEWAAAYQEGSDWRATAEFLIDWAKFIVVVVQFLTLLSRKGKIAVLRWLRRKGIARIWVRWVARLFKLWAFLLVVFDLLEPVVHYCSRAFRHKADAIRSYIAIEDSIVRLYSPRHGEGE